MAKRVLEEHANGNMMVNIQLVFLAANVQMNVEQVLIWIRDIAAGNFHGE